MLSWPGRRSNTGLWSFCWGKKDELSLFSKISAPRKDLGKRFQPKPVLGIRGILPSKSLGGVRGGILRARLRKVTTCALQFIRGGIRANGR
jgi:hypothetical protein